MERGDVDEWVRASGPRLHRMAYVLVGDWALAQDLVQDVCTAVWSSASRIDSPDAYARRVMVRTATSRWRRKWRGEVPHGELPDGPGDDPWDAADDRTRLAVALRRLPARQRAVLVLRFYEDLSEVQTAEVLGWPAGTVKSTTARALVAVREMGCVDDEEVLR